MSICVQCGSSMHEQGRQPYVRGVCNQCRLAKNPNAYRCVECGMLADANDYHGGERMKADGTCFYCDLWRQRVRDSGPGDIVVDGIMYAYDPRHPKKGGEKFLLGHGGREFKILLADGSTVVTNNLWCGGNVPEHFRSRLPDNAKFVS